MKIIIEPFLTNDEGEEGDIKFTEQQKERLEEIISDALLDHDEILEFLEKNFGKKDWYPDFVVEHED